MSETKTLHRNFWVWEFEKEERWLNEMAQEGWALQNAGFCTYTFEKTEPGQYIIRLAMLDSSPDFESFMGELEPQSVGHWLVLWTYSQPQPSLGPLFLTGFLLMDSVLLTWNKIGQMVRPVRLQNLPSRRYQHLQRCIAGMAEPALRHVFGLRAGTHPWQTGHLGRRARTPRVTIFPLEISFFSEFQSSCHPLHSDAGGYITATSK